MKKIKNSATSIILVLSVATIGTLITFWLNSSFATVEYVDGRFEREEARYSKSLDELKDAIKTLNRRTYEIVRLLKD